MAKLQLLKFLPDKPLGLIAENIGKRWTLSGNVLRRDTTDCQSIGYDYTPEGAIADIYIKHGGLHREECNAQWKGTNFCWINKVLTPTEVSIRVLPPPVVDWIDSHHGDRTAEQLVAILEAVREANKKRNWHEWTNEHIADLIKIYFGLSGSMFEAAQACKVTCG